MRKVVLATSSRGKLSELTDRLAGTGLHVVAQTQLGVGPVAETGLTFIENALLKARHAAASTGLAAIADDSGLVVKALNGAPGIHSARYAGINASDQENIAQLLGAMQEVPDEQRQAEFYCVLVSLRHERDPGPQVFHGCWQGVIARRASGDSGFGYDPIFFIPELQCTAAELTPVMKNTLSHRGQALRQLLAALNNV